MSYWGERIDGLHLPEQDLEWLAREAARKDNPFAEAAQAEINRRSAQAQIDAAQYMWWSVLAIAAAAIISAAVQIAAWLWPHPLNL